MSVTKKIFFSRKNFPFFVTAQVSRYGTRTGIKGNQVRILDSTRCCDLHHVFPGILATACFFRGGKAPGDGESQKTCLGLRKCNVRVKHETYTE